VRPFFLPRRISNALRDRRRSEHDEGGENYRHSMHLEDLSIFDAKKTCESVHVPARRLRCSPQTNSVCVVASKPVLMTVLKAGSL
jgi:hypothetical protein